MKKKEKLHKHKGITTIDILAGAPDDALLSITENGQSRLVRAKAVYRNKTIVEWIKGILLRRDFSKKYKIDYEWYENQ